MITHDAGQDERIRKILATELATFPVEPTNVTRMMHAVDETCNTPEWSIARGEVLAAKCFSDGYKMAWLERKAQEIEATLQPTTDSYTVSNYEQIVHSEQLDQWIEERCPKAFDAQCKRSVRLAIEHLAKFTKLKIGEPWHEVLVPLETIIIALMEVPELAL